MAAIAAATAATAALVWQSNTQVGQQDLAINRSSWVQFKFALSTTPYEARLD